MVNVTVLRADENLACEDLLIRHPVLQQLQVDTCILLENNRSVLDRGDCSSIINLSLNQGGSVSRIILSRLNSIRESETANRSK